MPQRNQEDRLESSATLQWVSLSLTAINPKAQRPQDEEFVDHIVANFDPEQVGYPVVSHRDGKFYIIDGQHRIAAIKLWNESDKISIECRVYEGLSSEEEAEMFLRNNDKKTVPTFTRFQVATEANWAVEVEINKIVKQCGLKVSQGKAPGSISAVTTLRRVYDRAGATGLAKTLLLIRDGFGDVGMGSTVIDAMALIVQRYGDQIDGEIFIKKMASTHGGLTGVLNRAAVIQNTTGRSKANCVAAAIIDAYNTRQGGKKLTTWWKAEAQEKAS